MNYSQKQSSAYLLSHNGLGDNIIMFGAIYFLLDYYQTINFLCKYMYYDNIKLMFLNNPNVIIIPFNEKNEDEGEGEECTKIITPQYEYSDIFICGGHKNYLYTKITHPLLNYIKTPNLHLKYDFISEFYSDINMGIDIFYDKFDIPSTIKSQNLLQSINNYRIIFTHTSASNKTIDLHNILDKYITLTDHLIINANLNYYNVLTYPDKHKDAQQFINIPIAYYIDIIKNANEIYVIDSCFFAIVLPLRLSNRLKATIIKIFERNGSFIHDY